MNAVVEPVRPQYFYAPPEKAGSYALGAEHIADIEHEIRVLHEQHWNDTEVRYRDDGMNPDYDRYARDQKNGHFIVFTARHIDTAELVANLMYFLSHDYHNKDNLVGVEDAFFVTPAHRKGRLAIRLLDYAEKVLKSLGVDYVGMSDKSPCGGADLSRLLKRRGYAPVAVYYLKEL